MRSKITPTLWFDGTAEEAAMFYSSLFPDSRIVSVNRSAADNPSTKAGEVLTVEFELAGQPRPECHGRSHGRRRRRRRRSRL